MWFCYSRDGQVTNRNLYFIPRGRGDIFWLVVLFLCLRLTSWHCSHAKSGWRHILNALHFSYLFYIITSFAPAWLFVSSCETVNSVCTLPRKYCTLEFNIKHSSWHVHIKQKPHIVRLCLLLNMIKLSHCFHSRIHSSNCRDRHNQEYL